MKVKLKDVNIPKLLFWKIFRSRQNIWSMRTTENTSRVSGYILIENCSVCLPALQYWLSFRLLLLVLIKPSPPDDLRQNPRMINFKRLVWQQLCHRIHIKSKVYSHICSFGSNDSVGHWSKLYHNLCEILTVSTFPAEWGFELWSCLDAGNWASTSSTILYNFPHCSQINDQYKAV